MGVPVYLRMLSKHAGQGPGWSKCWADRTHSSSCQHGARGYQSMPGAGAGSSSQRGGGAVVCPHGVILDVQERGSVPQRCPEEHVPVHVRGVHRPGSGEPSPAEH